MHRLAEDDVVERHEDAEGASRPPLVVLEPLGGFLDQAGIGEGPIEIEPVGEGHSNVTFLVTRGGAG